MTFLLQKHHAIHRTQVRDSLRSFASGVALTGRLAAACLLLAGFLGVGSATAQAPPTILRLGGGAVTLSLDPDGANEETPDPTDDLQWHHYQIGSAAAVPNPAGHDGTSHVTTSVLIGGLALVTVDDVTNFKLTISPIATGSFKIALSEDADMPLTKGDDMTNVGRPHEFVIVSANAPMLTGKTGAADTYNQQAKDDNMDIMLTPHDKTAAEPIGVIDLFTDPDDVTLAYEAKADPVKKTNKDGKEVDTAIVSATISTDNKLMISLLEEAANGDKTYVWLTATDPAGEQARKRYTVTTSSPKNPYVKDGIDDVTLREDAASGQMITLSGDAFADEDLALDGDNTTHDTATSGDGDRALEISVAIGDEDAQKIPGATADAFTWVTTYMNAAVAGNGGETPTMTIDPRAAGEVTFTVTATDKGAVCPADDGKAPTIYEWADKDNMPTNTLGDAVKCFADVDGNRMADADEKIDLYKDSKTATTTFKVTIVSKTTPSVMDAIDALSLESDKAPMGAVTINLEDLNGEKADTPMAFNKYGQTLDYVVELEKEKVKVGSQEIEMDVAIAEVEGSMVTVTPIWRAGDPITVKATVTATNGSGETAETTFDVTVKPATTPVVNPPLVTAGLFNLDAKGAGTANDTLSVMRGDKLEVDLRDIRKVIPGGEMLSPVPLPLFIDPNAKTVKDGELLPGGLQLRIRPEDVVTAHLYEDQSSDNDIYTSMGRLMLDPKEAMLTFYATAPNTMTVTIHATDRDRNTAMASIAIMVPAVPSVEGEELPTEVSLSQNYPNPFNPRTTIEYALPEAGDVSLIVYDMLGREVTTLLEGPQAAGRHTVNFDANHLSNGTYVYRLVAPNKTITRTMVLVK